MEHGSCPILASEIVEFYRNKEASSLEPRPSKRATASQRNIGIVLLFCIRRKSEIVEHNEVRVTVKSRLS